MSHDATAWARKQQTGNTPAKFLLMVLADYAGSDYSCWPSQDTLSKLTEMSERTIRRAAATLVDQGLIRVFYRYRSDNSRRSCRYQLLLDGPETELPEIVDWRSMKQAEPGGEPDSVTTDPPDTLTAPTGQAVQPYRSQSPVIPPTEPSKEPLPLIPGASRTARATRIPDDFYPSPEMQLWFKEQGYDQVIANPRVEHEKFCDYWRAKGGVTARKLDWAATWRNWMRTAAERVAPYKSATMITENGPVPPHYKPSTTDARIAQGQALADKYRKQGL